jgi:hypothetical protein
MGLGKDVYGIRGKLRVELTWNFCTWMDCSKHDVPNGNEILSGEFLNALDEEAKSCAVVHLYGMFEKVRAIIFVDHEYN